MYNECIAQKFLQKHAGEITSKGTMYQSFLTSAQLFFAEFLVSLAEYIPSIFGALLLLIVGAFFANAVRGVVVKIFESLHVSKLVANTPIEHFLKNAEIKPKLEVIVGSIVYWLVMLVVLQSVVAILGLSSLSILLSTVLSYIPRVIAAVVVLFFGVLLAGLVESVTKGALKTIDSGTSRLFSKVASYMVVTVAVMASISELGIANEFILILFIGFVVAVSLGAGLALGLGGQDLVKDLLKEWYKKTKKG